MRFTGKDEEINLSGDGSEKPEFGEWSWMTPQEVIDHVSTLSFYMEKQGKNMFLIFVFAQHESRLWISRSQFMKRS